MPRVIGSYQLVLLYSLYMIDTIDSTKDGRILLGTAVVRYCFAWLWPVHRRMSIATKVTTCHMPCGRGVQWCVVYMYLLVGTGTAGVPVQR